MPEEASVTKEGIPLDKMATILLLAGIHLVSRKWRFFLIRHRDSTVMLIMGARLVARIAPKIPIFSGKIKI